MAAGLFDPVFGKLCAECEGCGLALNDPYFFAPPCPVLLHSANHHVCVHTLCGPAAPSCHRWPGPSVLFRSCPSADACCGGDPSCTCCAELEDLTLATRPTASPMPGTGAGYGLLNLTSYRNNAEIILLPLPRPSCCRPGPLWYEVFPVSYSPLYISHRYFYR